MGSHRLPTHGRGAHRNFFHHPFLNSNSNFSPTSLIWQAWQLRVNKISFKLYLTIHHASVIDKNVKDVLIILLLFINLDTMQRIDRKSLCFQCYWIGYYNWTGSNLDHSLRRWGRSLWLYCHVYFLVSNLYVSSFFSYKDRLPKCLRASIVYKFVCPRYGLQYVGSSSRTLGVRAREHAGVSVRTGKPLSQPPQSAIRDHAIACSTPNSSWLII